MYVCVKSLSRYLFLVSKLQTAATAQIVPHKSKSGRQEPWQDND